jgi:integrase
LETALSVEFLEALQNSLLAGDFSYTDQRSPHTVNSVLRAVKTFAKFCHRRKWICEVPQFVAVPYDDSMKGRPITGEEFDRMIEATPAVVGKGVAESWIFLLRVLWESGFRVSDAMNFHWVDTRHIHITTLAKGAAPSAS